MLDLEAEIETCQSQNCSLEWTYEIYKSKVSAVHGVGHVAPPCLAVACNFQPPAYAYKIFHTGDLQPGDYGR